MCQVTARLLISFFISLKLRNFLVRSRWRLSPSFESRLSEYASIYMSSRTCIYSHFFKLSIMSDKLYPVSAIRLNSFLLLRSVLHFVPFCVLLPARPLLCILLPRPFAPAYTGRYPTASMGEISAASFAGFLLPVYIVKADSIMVRISTHGFSETSTSPAVPVRIPRERMTDGSSIKDTTMPRRRPPMQRRSLRLPPSAGKSCCKSDVPSFQSSEEVRNTLYFLPLTDT